MNEPLVKKAIITYIYNILNTKYPEYFKVQTVTNKDLTKITYPTVFWSDTIEQRPIDSTECVLDVIHSASLVKGIDGDIFSKTVRENNQDVKKYYIKEEEPTIITVNIKVSSMKNAKLSLTDLKAQNLTEEVCAYIRNRLKSGSALDYFGWENDIFTPITVLTSNEDLSDIDDVTYFETTKNKFSSQFSCRFRFVESGSRETKIAANAQIDLKAQGVDINFNVNES